MRERFGFFDASVNGTHDNFLSGLSQEGKFEIAATKKRRKFYHLNRLSNVILAHVFTSKLESRSKPIHSRNSNLGQEQRCQPLKAKISNQNAQNYS